MGRARWKMAAALLLIPHAAGGAEKPAPQPVDGKISWVYDYAEGRRIARESGRPMFVVFRCER